MLKLPKLRLPPLATIVQAIKHAPGATRRAIWNFLRIWLWHIISFMILLLVYLLYHALSWVGNRRWLPAKLRGVPAAQIRRLLNWLSAMTRQEEKTINRLNLIDLAMRSLRFKKSRSLITVGGMAIGIGIIVFLVSLGFGLQKLVVGRVARLDELKQTDISALPGGNDRITDGTISRIKENPDVEHVLPMIASVSRVNYQNSVSDVAVYGVTATYLENSAVRPIHGEIFDSNELAFLPVGQVAGISTTAEGASAGDQEQKVLISLPEDEWLRVRNRPGSDGTLVGYTRKTNATLTGIRVRGDFFPEAAAIRDIPFIEDGDAPWLQANYPLWQKTDCVDEAVNCQDGYEIVRADSGEQLSAEGYVAQRFATVWEAAQSDQGMVLGDTTDESGLLGESSTDDEQLALAGTPTLTSLFGGDVNSEDGAWIEIASESATVNQKIVQQVQLHSGAHRQAVVNMAMVKLLGMDENEAVGTTFTTSFVAVGELLDEGQPKIESLPSEYTIVGVIPTDDAPYYYVPFVDLRGMGISSYSQLKVVAKNADKLEAIRRQIENYGFSSHSVADTVKQIDQLFATLRVVLVIIGLVALSIAALGMFNTLTVSLLERTREVGLMKAMGMKSHEVQELFLTESLVMGFFGGIGGIVFGWMLGNTLSVILSVFSLTRGMGVMDVSYLPPGFITFIFILSMIVGVCTGIYPARRATRISALNALRYE